MKHSLLLVLAILFASCGPSESDHRVELRSIDSELFQLGIAAQQHRAQMSNAEFDAFIGSFAAGYGAVSGDYCLSGDGASTAYDATHRADVAGYSLDQVRNRVDALTKRRSEILNDLD